MPSLQFLFDLDGTLTREELLPKIAREVGLEREIGELTRLTMAGTIPFVASFIERVRILKQVPISRVQEITDTVEIDPHIAEFIRNRRESCAVVTGNLDVWTERLRNRLGIRFFCSKAEAVGEKIIRIASLLDKSHVPLQLGTRCVAIGDGYNDVAMFRQATYGVAFGGVHPPAIGLLDASTHAVYDSRTLCRLLSQLS